MAMARTGTEAAGARPVARRALPLLALLTLAIPHQGAAHSEVRTSSPAEGAVLAAPPAEIALRFTEPMQVSSLRLFDAAGREAPLRREGARTAQVAEVRAAVIGAPLPPGEYRIEYRGISADGHVGGGTVRFRIAPGAR